jgi:hypothetical protein
MKSENYSSVTALSIKNREELEKNKYKSKFTNLTENYIEDHKIFEEEYMRYEAIVDNFIEETVSYDFKI